MGRHHYLGLLAYIRTHPSHIHIQIRIHVHVHVHVHSTHTARALARVLKREWGQGRKGKGAERRVLKGNDAQKQEWTHSRYTTHAPHTPHARARSKAQGWEKGMGGDERETLRSSFLESSFLRSEEEAEGGTSGGAVAAVGAIAVFFLGPFCILS